MNSTTGWGEARGTTKGISDSRKRALGEDAEKLEHSKADLRKSLSYPHSLVVPGGQARPAVLARHAPVDRQKDSHLSAGSCPCVTALAAAAARPAENSATSEAGSQSQHTGMWWLQAMDGEDAVVLDTTNLELFWHMKQWHCCSKCSQRQEIGDLFPCFSNKACPRPQTVPVKWESSPAKLVEIHLTYSSY